MPGNVHSPSPELVASWPRPNYVDPIRSTWMPAYAGILLAMSSLMVLTRLCLRAKHYAGGLGLDDVRTCQSCWSRYRALADRWLAIPRPRMARGNSPDDADLSPNRAMGKRSPYLGRATQAL